MEKENDYHLRYYAIKYRQADKIGVVMAWEELQACVERIVNRAVARERANLPQIPLDAD